MNNMDKIMKWNPGFMITLDQWALPVLIIWYQAGRYRYRGIQILCFKLYASRAYERHELVPVEEVEK